MQKQGAPFKGEKADLVDTLQVAVGARVMLTRNIDVQDGLVNGCFGTVAKIITQTHNSVPVVQSVDPNGQNDMYTDLQPTARSSDEVYLTHSTSLDAVKLLGVPSCSGGGQYTWPGYANEPRQHCHVVQQARRHGDTGLKEDLLGVLTAQEWAPCIIWAGRTPAHTPQRLCAGMADP
ncbi:hypothetical protein SRHO_G00178740 [Serrasalmus rhombeus]